MSDLIRFMNVVLLSCTVLGLALIACQKLYSVPIGFTDDLGVAVSGLVKAKRILQVPSADPLNNSLTKE